MVSNSFDCPFMIFHFHRNIFKIIAEGQFPGRTMGFVSDTPTKNSASLPKDIHGSPPQCFVVKLSEVIGSFKSLRKMALFWYKVVAEVSVPV